MYQLVIDKYAQKQLGKITAPHFNRIIKAINEFSRESKAGWLQKTYRPPRLQNQD